jgi:polar amino acid transport system permease protein
MSYEFDFSFLEHYWSDILNGIWLTLRMTLLSIVPGFVLGTGCALGRIYGPPWLVIVAKVYVEFIRNTPLVIQVFWLFFGLSALSVHISALLAAVVALAVNEGAYAAEIMRAGFEALPKAQQEAAASLALSRWQTIWYIEIPQAIERVYPALASQFVILLLATSIMSQISADELTGVAYSIQAFTFRGFEAYAVIAIIYLVVVMAMRLCLWTAMGLIFPRRRAVANG